MSFAATLPIGVALFASRGMGKEPKIASDLKLVNLGLEADDHELARFAKIVEGFSPVKASPDAKDHR